MKKEHYKLLSEEHKERFDDLDSFNPVTFIYYIFTTMIIFLYRYIVILILSVLLVRPYVSELTDMINTNLVIDFSFSSLEIFLTLGLIILLIELLVTFFLILQKRKIVKDNGYHIKFAEYDRKILDEKIEKAKKEREVKN